jgi:parvulin-like peptidyl-prolyl isomerase
MMMNLFRSGGLGQWIVAGVASLVIVVFVVEFRTARGPANAKVSAECTIKMPGVCVTPKDFFASYGLIVPPGVSPKQIKALKLPEQVLDGLVERELLVKKAESQGIGISNDELDSQLMQGRAHVSLPAAAAPMLGAQLGLCLPAGRSYGCSPNSPLVRLMSVRRSSDGHFDTSKYEREVRVRTNRGPKQFRELQEREAIAERMRGLIRSSVRVSREQAFLEFERENSKAVARYVTIDRDWYGRNVAELSDQAISQWADQNKAPIEEALKTEKEGVTVGCPLVSEIAMPFESDVTDQAKVDLRKKIDAAYELLTKGKRPFDAVARQMSQTDTAIVGGQLGCLSEKSNPAAKELLESVASLKPGQVSPVIETSRGFYILRLNGHVTEASLDSEARMSVARHQASRALVDAGVTKLAEELIKKVKAGTDLDAALSESLAKLPARSAPNTASAQDDTSNAKAPRVVTSPQFTPSGTPGQDFSPFSGVGQRVFALAKPGSVTEAPVPTLRGPAVLVLVSKEPAKREDFDRQADELMRSLQEEKSEAALVEYLARARRALSGKLEVSNEYKNLKIRGSED